MILIDSDHLSIFANRRDRRHGALAARAVLISANLQDFEQVPGLRVEDWL